MIRKLRVATPIKKQKFLYLSSCLLEWTMKSPKNAEKGPGNGKEDLILVSIYFCYLYSVNNMEFSGKLSSRYLQINSRTLYHLHQ